MRLVCYHFETFKMCLCGWNFLHIIFTWIITGKIIQIICCELVCALTAHCSEPEEIHWMSYHWVWEAAVQFTAISWISCMRLPQNTCIQQASSFWGHKTLLLSFLVSLLHSLFFLLHLLKLKSMYPTDFLHGTISCLITPSKILVTITEKMGIQPAFWLMLLLMAGWP